MNLFNNTYIVNLPSLNVNFLIRKKRNLSRLLFIIHHIIIFIHNYLENNLTITLKLYEHVIEYHNHHSQNLLCHRTFDFLVHQNQNPKYVSHAF